MNPVNIDRVDRHYFPKVADRVAAVYVKCFGSEPWNEVFQPSDVINRVEEVLEFQDSILLIAANGEHVLGATLHYPLPYNKSVQAAVAPDYAGAMYCEELFVSGACQRRGVGGRLFDVATGIAMALGYDRRVLRTASEYEEAKRFYMARGYRTVGRMQCQSKKKIGGSVRTVVDPRIVLVSESLSWRLS